MADLALALDPATGAFDAFVLGGDLAADNSLRTAVLISLLTDREAPDADAGDRRGWWGDALSDRTGDRIGSHLWLLARERATPQVAERAVRYAREALAWMTDDRVARRVDVTAEYRSIERLDLLVTVHGPAGPERLQFALLWTATLGYPYAGPPLDAEAAARAAFLLEQIYFIQYPMVTP